jgi:hypothetical protein
VGRTMRTIAVCGGIALVAAMAACTDSDSSQTHPSETKTQVSGGGQGSSPTAADAINATQTLTGAPLPSVLPAPASAGSKTLLKVGGASGSLRVGEIRVNPGDVVYLNLDCIGDGKLVLDWTRGSYDIPCSATHIFPAGNRVTFAKAGRLSISVKAPSSVKWGLRIEEQ